jgi:hypothetical protein
LAGKVGSLFELDRRSRLSRRIEELVRIYMDAIGPGPLSPIQAGQVQQAAQLAALAEQERAKLAEGTTTVNDVVRIEGRARLAFKALGIRAGSRPQQSALAQMLRGADG